MYNINLRKFAEAADHAERAITYARIYNGTELKESMLYMALANKSTLLALQGKYVVARIFIEMAYNHMAELHGPEYPLTLEAAYKLTFNLLMTEDYYNAERYGRIADECHTRPVDPESQDVAKAAFNLSTAMHGLIMANAVENTAISIDEVEELGKKALSIMKRIYGIDNRGLPTYTTYLSRVLQLRGKSCDVEILDLMKQSLAVHLRFNGPDHISVALSNHNLGMFHQNSAADLIGVALRNKLRQAEAYYIKAAQISTELNGINHPQTQAYAQSVQYVWRQ